MVEFSVADFAFEVFAKVIVELSVKIIKIPKKIIFLISSVLNMYINVSGNRFSNVILF